MKIAHIAIWVSDLEMMKDFYVKYFSMMHGEKYINKKKNFSSYFLSFKNSTSRLEIMYRPDISEYIGDKGLANGLTHFAISVGTKEKVDQLTKRLENDNFRVASAPRTTGDGYYESVILDPEGNHVEIVD